ncbi:diguanylate cyclase [Aliikangiella marina]|uniref:diguanylate cyclase n=1 Tax=Aliikangiella marina TaxID=1712262 RepID=A0A545T575_9GAMM|nr:diguanylate cyclase [Aliikangiella marina]TQV72318.1 diguanylate cyclase [Aliikangiella marina]
MSFHLGSSLVLLCLLRFGYLPGLIASTISSLSLLIIFDNPYFFLLLGMEVIVIGLLLSRGLFLLFADIIYWLLIGAPLTFVILYFNDPEFAYNNQLLIMKQAINGVLYAAIASVVAPFLVKSESAVTWNGELPAMSIKIFEQFSTITAITGIMIGLVLVELSVRDSGRQLQNSLSNKAYQASAFIRNYIESHQAKIQQSADSLGLYRLLSTDTLTFLNTTQKTYPGFLTMLIADENGGIIAGAPNNFYEVLKDAPENQRSVIDRDYFIEAKATGRSYISQAFKGRGFGNDIIVAISAPVYEDNQFKGVIEGSLNLKSFQQIENNLGENSQDFFILLDKNNNILYASKAAQLNVMDQLEYIIPDTNYSEIAQLLQINQATNRRDFFFESKPTVNGWTTFILRDTAQINNIVEAYYRYLVILFSIIFLLTFIISRLLSKNLTGPLENIVNNLTLDSLDKRSDKEDSFTAEIFSIKQRLRQAKRVYLDFQNELQLEVEKRTRELSDANIKLEKLSREDSLTKLLNRRAFDEELVNDLKKSIRFQTPMCLALVDIDHFKNINDSYGHPVGDKFIQFLGKSLKQNMQRNTDIVARVGGEEFAILFHADSPTACQSKLESCRAAAMSIKLDVNDKKLGISISIGALFIIPPPDITAKELYTRADQLLYKSKTEGRNRLTFQIFD